jgi:hypothetical protein
MTVDITTWSIRPFDGLEGIVPGGIRLGEHRSALNERFAAAFGERLGERRTFRKGAESTGLCDQYPDGGLILFYDHQERLVYLEVFEPAPVAYKGVPLLARPSSDVVADLRGHGCRLVEHGITTCEVPEEGFNLSLDFDEPEKPVDCVGVFSQGEALEDSPPPQMTDGPRLPGTDTHRIVPHQGTEAARLGEDRHALRARLGAAMAFHSYGGVAQDSYHEHGLTLTFDADDRLTALAIHYSGREGTATLEGVQLLSRPYEEVAADLERAGVRVVPGELSARLPDHGVTLNLVSYTNPAQPVCAVLVGGPSA